VRYLGVLHWHPHCPLKGPLLSPDIAHAGALATFIGVSAAQARPGASVLKFGQIRGVDIVYPQCPGQWLRAPRWGAAIKGPWGVSAPRPAPWGYSNRKVPR
jgi:hypothetical protein